MMVKTVFIEFREVHRDSCRRVV